MTATEPDLRPGHHRPPVLVQYHGREITDYMAVIGLVARGVSPEFLLSLKNKDPMARLSSVIGVLECIVYRRNGTWTDGRDAC